MTDTIRAWHFTGNTLRDGRPIPPIGEVLRHDGPLEMCVSGLHASRQPLDALEHAPGPIVHRVECGSDILEVSDKLVCAQRTILWSADATTLLRAFARWCALQVVDLWDCPDVVREYLVSGKESLRAAVWAATVWASKSAAESAAAESARDAQNQQLETMLRELERKD